MIIALLGDVHANLPALQTVLAHAHAHGASAIWNIGDFVGYGAAPNEVVQLFREESAVSILGNYDLKVLGFSETEKTMRETKRPEKYLAFKWAHDQLNDENRRYLQSLPETARLKVASWRVLITHASPASAEEHLFPETPESRLEELAKIARADIVVVGHSHRYFTRSVAKTLFINTGSVGRPDDGDPRACYALLEINKHEAVVSHYRLEYDVTRAVTAIRDAHLPEAFAQMILQGRNLDTIL